MFLLFFAGLSITTQTKKTAKHYKNKFNCNCGATCDWNRTDYSFFYFTIFAKINTNCHYYLLTADIS